MGETVVGVGARLIKRFDVSALHGFEPRRGRVEALQKLTLCGILTQQHVVPVRLTLLFRVESLISLRHTIRRTTISSSKLSVLN